MKYILLALIAYILYMTFKKHGDGVANEETLENPAKETNLSLLTQPQQKFPLQMPETPRVDNADQPWYSFDRSFLGRDDLTFIDELQGDVSKSIMSYDTNAFWAELESKYTH